jgi:hypothetical protein
VAALEVPAGWAREQAAVALAYDPARITVFPTSSSGGPA